jgi:WG containing repeat
VIPAQFANVGSFSQGLAPVQVNSQWGYINRSAKLVIQHRFEEANNFRENLAAVRLQGKIGYIDRLGTMMIPPTYTYGGQFSEGRAVVAINEKYGYIDATGKVVVPLKYSRAEPFHQGLARLDYKDYIDLNGNSILGTTRVDFINDFQDGLAPFRSLQGKLGYINRKGKIIVPAIYDWPMKFPSSIREGLILVRQDKKYGYLDAKTGQVVIPPRFSDASLFEHGLARVTLQGRAAYIDPKGTVIFFFPG